MIFNEPNQDVYYYPKHFIIGGKVISNEESEYPGLVGTLLEVRTGDDRETENDTPDFYCSFEFPTLPHVIERTEANASVLYGSPKKIGDLGLDFMIMSPGMIDPVPQSEESPYCIDLYVVREEWTISDRSGEDEHILFSGGEAQGKIRELVSNLHAEDGKEWIGQPGFTEESTDTSYCCFLEDDYCSNHYRAEIFPRRIPLNPDVLNQIGWMWKEMCVSEDVLSRIESDWEDVSPEEQAQIRTYHDMAETLDYKLSNSDTFMETYWNGIDCVVKDLLEDIRQ